MLGVLVLCPARETLSARWAGGLSLPLPPSLSSSLYFYSLKLECEKLATEKTEIQRHYVMVSELHLKGGGRWGVSPLNHQRMHSPGMLGLPCAVWPGPEICFLWLLWSGFPPK